WSLLAIEHGVKLRGAAAAVCRGDGERGAGRGETPLVVARPTGGAGPGGVPRTPVSPAPCHSSRWGRAGRRWRAPHGRGLPRTAPPRSAGGGSRPARGSSRADHPPHAPRRRPPPISTAPRSPPPPP